MSTLGLDRSGNGNDFIAVNLTVSDQMLDSPTNNFATLNPLQRFVTNTQAPTEGNLKTICGSTNTANKHCIASTMGVTSGKWYFEVMIGTTANSHFSNIGVGNSSVKEFTELMNTTANSNNVPWDGSYGWGYDAYNGNKEHSNTQTSYGSQATLGDIISVAIDMDNSKIWFGSNGTWIASGNPATGANAAYTNVTGNIVPVVNTQDGATAFVTMNFGQDSSFAGNKTAQGNQDGNSIGDFYYTPPTGFLALCTKNLPDVAVVPSEHFDVRLRTGTGSEVTVSDLEFQPDLLWTKTRSNAVNHNLHSSLMAQNYSFLQPNTTNAENSSASTYYMTPTSTGYTVGTGDNINQNTYTFVDWLWKAGGGSGSSNTTGSINSTVSANTDAGFSIVGWVGNEGSDESIGHGLSKAPEMILTWVRDEAWGNQVYHKDMGTNKKMMISETTAAETDTDVWADTAPTSSVFYVGTDLMTNWDDRNYIGYCFHSVDGYSKVGSYEGNDSADGTFVYTGFRPAFVMVKNIDDGYNWIISDTKREPTNVMANELYPNTSAAEYISSGERWDFLSNGFKLRSGSALTNEDTHIYIAFAETPFKYSNAR